MLEVVGAVIVKEDKFLAAQRPLDKSLGGYWEFPGGKIDAGEQPEEALQREIKEELNSVVAVNEFITRDIYSYDFGDIALATYFCKVVTGEPELSEHMDMKWITIDEIDSLDWAPADTPTLNILKKTNLQGV